LSGRGLRADKLLCENRACPVVGEAPRLLRAGKEVVIPRLAKRLANRKWLKTGTFDTLRHPGDVVVSRLVWKFGPARFRVLGTTDCGGHRTRLSSLPTVRVMGDRCHDTCWAGPPPPGPCSCCSHWRPPHPWRVRSAPRPTSAARSIGCRPGPDLPDGAPQAGVAIYGAAQWSSFHPPPRDEAVQAALPRLVRLGLDPVWWTPIL
jgi:hypothetical protein